MPPSSPDLVPSALLSVCVVIIAIASGLVRNVLRRRRLRRRGDVRPHVIQVFDEFTAAIEKFYLAESPFWREQKDPERYARGEYGTSLRGTDAYDQFHTSVGAVETALHNLEESGLAEADLLNRYVSYIPVVELLRLLNGAVLATYLHHVQGSEAEARAWLRTLRAGEPTDGAVLSREEAWSATESAIRRLSGVSGESQGLAEAKAAAFAAYPEPRVGITEFTDAATNHLFGEVWKRCTHLSPRVVSRRG